MRGSIPTQRGAIRYGHLIDVYSEVILSNQENIIFTRKTVNRLWDDSIIKALAPLNYYFLRKTKAT